MCQFVCMMHISRSCPTYKALNAQQYVSIQNDSTAMAAHSSPPSHLIGRTNDICADGSTRTAGEEGYFTNADSPGAIGHSHCLDLMDQLLQLLLSNALLFMTVVVGIHRALPCYDCL